jgi:aminomethyltransferase
VEVSGEYAGAVTSGNFSPILGRGIALAFIEKSTGALEGDQVVVRMKDGELTAHVHKPPFVKDGRPAVELAAH